jgi:hypothetical protein
MKITLKSIMKCEVLGLDEKKIKVLVSAMFFLKLANMLQPMKRFAKTFNLFPSSLPSQVCNTV